MSSLIEGHEEIDLEKLGALFAEQSKWATLDVTIEEVAEDNKALIQDLAKYDKNSTIPLLAGLLTCPEYQSQCIRLEILVALALSYCRDGKKANISEAVRWFSLIDSSRCVIGEDPAEDVFVSLVQDQCGDYLLLEGVWESSGFYTQRILDVLSTMPDNEKFGQIKKSFRSLLVISDIACKKSGLHRYQLGSDARHSTLSQNKIPGRKGLISRVVVTNEELLERGVNLSDIKPFLLSASDTSKLKKQQVGCSELEYKPLSQLSDTQVTVILPSALSVAARNFVIGCIKAENLNEAFNKMLAHSYSHLIYNTPLLGGPMRAPVSWQKIEKHRFSNFVFEVDKGYFISYHLFLTSIDTHTNGDFKTIYNDEGPLTKALQESINKVIEKFTERPGFKQGLIVLAGCGWGKGYATQEIEVDHPKWRFQGMPAADLIRLSWLDDMSPSYFWRIQDGLEAIREAGVHFVNPNGILNLIGWVRGNNGHFVPHADLPDDEISPQRPLTLNPPLNLLREIRADSDRGFDRHSQIDNTGVWHKVQHVSPNPYFSSESSQRIYASIDDLDNDTLTSVYEGNLILWLSLTATNIDDRSIIYQLWEMANEWLHRIGNELEIYFQHRKNTNPIKVYADFQDNNPPEAKVLKPKVEELLSLCKVHRQPENNAYQVTFEPGYLRAFSIAENTAERIFVLNITSAYLSILSIENAIEEARKITARIVKNNEARSFHMFQAQTFLDFTRGSLKNDLITIDSIDDASTKIGLGWRAQERDAGNKVEGRSKCIKFLNKLVDELLSKITSTLSKYERIGTLNQLLINNETSRAESDHWKKTSAAIIGLHGNNDKTISRYVEQSSKFAGAGIASRVLAEIALCESPLDSGGELSDIELSKIIAKISLVIQIGGTSNAIYYNVLKPEIMISALGDVLFQDEFGEFVVQPMLEKAVGDKFISNAPHQKSNYEDPSIAPTAKNGINAEFWETWKKEMGVDIDEARQIIGSLEDYGVDHHQAIYNIRKSEYLNIVCSNQINDEIAINFLESFTLRTRKHWHVPPDDYDIDDIEPWRYGRRLSLVSSPILMVENCKDPRLIISPGSLRESFAYILDGSYKGRLKQTFFKTKAMRDTWWGKASEGHSFNAEITKQLINAGWKTRENIDIPEILNEKLDKDYGDIDVLAWNEDNKILIIECKDISFARNYSEIASLLANFQGIDKTDGKPDKLKAHLNRVTVNLPQFNGHF